MEKESNVAEQVASKLAANKESVIKEALNHYFDGRKWDEAEIKKVASLVYHTDGTEVFCINDHVFVEFDRITTDVVINNEGVVTCSFKQDFTRHFG